MLLNPFRSATFSTRSMSVFGMRNWIARVSLSGIAVDRAGNVYIADAQFARVRMVNTAGTISTVAGGGSGGGGGPATSAALQGPFGLALDSQGNLYIAEGLGGSGTSMRVRKVTPSGIISTVAGGTATEMRRHFARRPRRPRVSAGGVFL